MFKGFQPWEQRDTKYHEGWSVSNTKVTLIFVFCEIHMISYPNTVNTYIHCTVKIYVAGANIVCFCYLRWFISADKTKKNWYKDSTHYYQFVLYVLLFIFNFSNVAYYFPSQCKTHLKLFLSWAQWCEYWTENIVTYVISVKYQGLKR